MISKQKKSRGISFPELFMDVVGLPPRWMKCRERTSASAPTSLCQAMRRMRVGRKNGEKKREIFELDD